MSWYKRKQASPFVPVEKGENYFDIGHSPEDTDAEMWFIDSKWQLHTTPAITKDGKPQSHKYWPDYFNAIGQVIARGIYSGGQANVIVEETIPMTRIDYTLDHIERTLEERFPNANLKGHTVRGPL